MTKNNELDFFLSGYSKIIIGAIAGTVGLESGPLAPRLSRLGERAGHRDAAQALMNPGS